MFMDFSGIPYTGIYILSPQILKTCFKYIYIYEEHFWLE